MKENKEVKISFRASHLSTIVSVTLVLLIAGIIALLAIAGANEGKKLRRNVELSVVMADSVSDTQTALIADSLSRQPYAGEARVITAAEALESWREDTGEDLAELFGVNPLSPEIALTLNPDFASPAEIDRISASLRQIPDVEDVASPETEMLESMNDNLERAALILSGVALVLLIISFILINNMVHLAVYSRRFTIHTMQLVGATDGFIRRPMMRSNALAGFISGVVASLILLLAITAGSEAATVNIASEIGWVPAAIVFIALPLLGAAICSLAAWGAATRFLRKDYDALFR